MERRKQGELFIALAGDSLRVFPRERVTPQVFRYIKANKQGIVRYLQHLKKVFEPVSTKNNIAVMAYNLALNINVNFLAHGESSDLNETDGIISCLPCEIEYLIRLGMDSEIMEQVGVIKKIFPGTRVVGHNPRGF